MKVVFTLHAQEDLSKIQAYYLEVAAHKADIVILAIFNRTIQLNSFPFSGAEEIFLKTNGLLRRYQIEGNFKIIYRIDEDIVAITQIFDVRQEPGSMVKNEDG